MRTSTEVKLSFVDVTALSDATETATTTAKPYSNMALLKDELFSMPKYATTERNYFVLDGSRKVLPDNPDDVAYVSNNASNTDRTFATNPKITVTFTQNHTSAGVTLYFGDDYPEEVKLTWYDADNTKIDAKTFTVDSLVYFCSNQVENYQKIVIEFIKTRYPNRYIKIAHILYGVNVVFSDEVVQNANIIEELDPTSATMSVNTASVSVVDQNDTYKPTNHDGLWKSIQVGQEISITETVEDKTIDCGTFYIDNWDFSNNIASFSLIDKIGMLDKTYFYDGEVYVNRKAKDILDALFSSCGVEKYTIEEGLGEILLNGHLGIQTHREALQQIVFAIGGVADCSRSDYINIYKPKRYVENNINTNRKFLGTTIKLDEYVSGVTVGFNKYTLSNDLTSLYEDILPKGTSKIEFSSPVDPSTITVTGGTLAVGRTNYAIVTMASTSTCKIEAKQYEITENRITANVDLIEGGEVANIKEYSGCTLVNSARALEVAKYILNYLQLRQIVDMRYINEGEGVGEWCLIADNTERYSTTGITKQNIDLTGGNIASVTSRGYSAVVTDYSYTGELWSGDIMGVI